MDTKKRSSLAFYPIYMTRRVLFIFLAFGLETYPGIGLMSLILMNLGIMIYVSNTRPIIGKLKNRLEIFNEFMVCCVSFHMLYFSEWVSNVKEGPLMFTRWGYGHVMNFFISYFIYANLSIYGYFIFKNFYSVYLRYSQRVSVLHYLYHLIMKLSSIQRKIGKVWNYLLSVLFCEKCIKMYSGRNKKVG